MNRSTLLRRTIPSLAILSLTPACGGGSTSRPDERDDSNTDDPSVGPDAEREALYVEMEQMYRDHFEEYAECEPDYFSGVDVSVDETIEGRMAAFGEYAEGADLECLRAMVAYRSCYLVGYSCYEMPIYDEEDYYDENGEYVSYPVPSGYESYFTMTMDVAYACESFYQDVQELCFEDEEPLLIQGTRRTE